MPGYQFAGVKVSYPFAHVPLDLILSDEMYLQSYAYTGEKDWLEGLDDRLLKHRGPKWARLVVLRADVAKLWPFTQVGGELSDPDPLTYRSGGPGRPSSMYLVETEFQRRCGSATVEASMAKESVYLAAWLRSAHPAAPPLTPKTIQNRMLSAFRAHAASRK